MDISRDILHLPDFLTLSDNCFVETTPVNNFMSIMYHINKEKAKLDGVENYKRVKKLSDPFNILCSHIMRHYNISVCNKGWVKLYEIMMTQGLMYIYRKFKTQAEG